MKIKHVTTAFWAVNISLGLAIVAYAATAFAGARPEPLADLREDSLGYAPAPERSYVRDIAPMQRVVTFEPRTPAARAPSVNLAQFITVRGFFGPQAGVQTAGNDQNQFWMACGDDVHKCLIGREGVGDISPTRGWTVKEFRRAENKVVFTNGREEQTLIVGTQAELQGIDPRYAALFGTPYNPADYKTTRTGNAAQSIFNVDPNEVFWALANQKAILDAAAFAPANDGIRFTRVTPDSILDARGLKSDDILQAVNGTRIDSIESLRNYLQSADIRNARTISLQINRAGQPIRIVFSFPTLQAR